MPHDRRTDAAAPPRLDAGTFAAAFEENGRLLWCVAAGVLGAPRDAEDVLQEAAIVALGKLDEFEPGTSFAAWMSQMVRYVALNRRRRHERAPRAVPADEALAVEAREPCAPPAFTPDGALADPERHFDDRLLGALATIGATARACLVLRTLSDLEYKEIARILDIPEGTAMSHVHRARAALRRVLAPTAEPEASR
jgi:RNA polymerase sigma-70 factor (ECF subfamily)